MTQNTVLIDGALGTDDVFSRPTEIVHIERARWGYRVVQRAPDFDGARETWRPLRRMAERCHEAIVEGFLDKGYVVQN